MKLTEIRNPLQGQEIDLKSAKGLFHLSEDDLDGHTLHPRVPDNFLVRNGFEDNVTERVSFAKTVDGALRGLSNDLNGKTFNVYTPVGSPKTMTPTTDMVPDSKITGEIWITEDVVLRKVGTITVGNATDVSFKYTFGDNSAKLWNWNWQQTS